VTAIVTERGVLRGPYEQSIQAMAKQAAPEPELATT
jgi:methylthioribose-1-phosphate isomerase